MAQGMQRPCSVLAASPWHSGHFIFSSLCSWLTHAPNARLSFLSFTLSLSLSVSLCLSLSLSVSLCLSLSPLTTKVLHLEQYRISQEAARSFEDDLDFCPSLSAKEVCPHFSALLLPSPFHCCSDVLPSLLSLSLSNKASVHTNPTTFF